MISETLSIPEGEGEMEDLSTRMKISVIIPTYNHKDHLKNLLNSLKDQTREPDEIIVIDDGSTDGTREMIGKKFPWVKLIAHSKNRGACAALNTGIKNAKHEYVAMLDQDLVLPKAWIEKIATEIEENEKIAIVSGLHVPPEYEEIEEREGREREREKNQATTVAGSTEGGV